MNENTEIAKRIAEEIEAIIAGDVPSEIEEDEPMTISEWLENALDFEYTVDSSFYIIGVRVCVGFGGPNIYVDTRHEEVQVFWGFTRGEWCISTEAAEAIEEECRWYADGMSIRA